MYKTHGEKQNAIYENNNNDDDDDDDDGDDLKVR